MSEQARHEFFDFVRDQWGPERAGQLMELLPLAGAKELATRDDLALTRAELRTGKAELRTDLRGEMAELRTDLRGEMAAMSTSIERRISDQGRSFIVATVSAYVGIAGVVFAAASLGR